MTGPEHYREAEHLESAIDDAESDDGARFMLTRAQIHATLALAAATAMGARGGMHDFDYEAWDAVCGVQDDEASDG